MTDYKIFAKRNKDFKFDVLEYDSMPKELRVQIKYIWRDGLGLDSAGRAGRSVAIENFRFIRDFICRELGLENLYEQQYSHRALTAAEE